MEDTFLKQFERHIKEQNDFEIPKNVLDAIRQEGEFHSYTQAGNEHRIECIEQWLLIADTEKTANKMFNKISQELFDWKNEDESALQEESNILRELLKR